jgi:protein-tyrosine phosphatase
MRATPPIAPDSGPVILEGAVNFRDLGGLPVEGGTIKPGRVYRSEALNTLTPTGTAALERLSVRLVCDLRTLDERRKDQTTWPGSRPRVLSVDEGIDLYGSTNEHIATMYGEESGEGTRQLVIGWYADLHHAYEPVIRGLFEAIADRHELPAVIHCSAGKDRTGFVTAMLLTALGASPEVIEADYLRTDGLFGVDRLRAAVVARIGRTPSDEVVEALRVDVDYLRASFAAIEAEFGSVDGYLRQAGLDDEKRRRLREVLVQTRPDGDGIGEGTQHDPAQANLCWRDLGGIVGRREH